MCWRLRSNPACWGSKLQVQTVLMDDHHGDSEDNDSKKRQQQQNKIVKDTPAMPSLIFFLISRLTQIYQYKITQTHTYKYKYRNTSALPWLRNLFDWQALADQLGLELQGSLLKTTNWWLWCQQWCCWWYWWGWWWWYRWSLHSRWWWGKVLTLFVRECNPWTGFASDFSFDF